MTLEIGAFVLSGQLDSSRHNSVFGYLKLASDYFLHLQLTGNAKPPLRGFGIQFRSASAEEKAETPIPDADSLPEEILALSRRQAGVCAKLAMEHLSEDSDEVIICLEWFSQNGPLTANLRARLIPSANEDEADDAVEDLAELDFEEPDLGGEDEDEDEDSEDPFGLFSEDFDQRLSESNKSPEDAGEGGNSDEKDSEATWSENPWSESLEDWENQELDPETRALHAQWAEIFSGKKDQPLPYLFEKTLRLPKPDAVETDEQAWPHVVAILEQLAKLSFVLDVCEHYRPVQTYRLLMEEVLQNAQVHPNLAASEIVQHYSTSDYCAECEAEFDINADDTLDSE